MSPDMCPDMICDLDFEETFVSLKYEQDDINKEYAYSKELWDNTNNIMIKLKTKPCNCSICRHDYTKIGIKKSIKWNSKMYNYYKKELKKLRDKGIRSGSLTSKNILEIKYAIVKEMALYHCEQSCLLRFRRHACKMKYRKQRYERYKQLGILY